MGRTWIPYNLWTQCMQDVGNTVEENSRDILCSLHILVACRQHCSNKILHFLTGDAFLCVVDLYNGREVVCVCVCFCMCVCVLYFRDK